ncbi:DinB family protein [Streptomyces thinghirensis]|uniref:DinB family protein n=1 Tax=Streptomyces thinghirensis TaxID=551547 RepID=UPI0031EB2BD3
MDGHAPRLLFWPGTAEGAVDWLRGLHGQWRARLGDLTDAEPDSTDRTVTLPWGEGMSLTDAAGWVNVELTKNVAEIGLPRILHGARNAPR